ncbi:hypothetical protein NDU88_004265 [Pleurodeles waltl]|uniref:Uncharacterized protein n=1 Tax=Pleurodeles waltl TaxID=8319 RepID=A0AAV7WRH1_PLEWA|nr:hypothetical protein NDU88_004265 [Pleurodeles waltl]
MEHFGGSVETAGLGCDHGRSRVCDNERRDRGGERAFPRTKRASGVQPRVRPTGVVCHAQRCGPGTYLGLSRGLTSPLWYFAPRRRCLNALVPMEAARGESG